WIHSYVDGHIFIHLTIKTEISVCGTNISRTQHCMKLKFGRYNAQDPRTCSVTCKVVWMSSSRIELCR
ncbi:hypothetical protein LDENG_00193250, partial [Lucifuga dentata]